jgi:cytoskeleton protein RodZ
LISTEIGAKGGPWVMNDFGGKLRLARERRGISLRQIATTTKISLGALEALERNDVSRLPGGIFTRSFVRSYATEVGLDPDATVHEFLERFQNVTVPAVPAPASTEAEATFDAQQRIAGLVVKALLITVPLLVLILYFTMRVRTPVTVSSTPSVVAPATAARPQPPAPRRQMNPRPSPSHPSRTRRPTHPLALLLPSSVSPPGRQPARFARRGSCR